MGKNEMTKLICEPRAKFGKQNRALRKSGFVPANIYGEGMEPVSVSLKEKDFMIAFKQAGETSIIECEIGGEKIPTLISDIAIHPVLDKVLHVDFRKVNLKKKVEVEVPVVLIGESLAVKTMGGVLLQQMNEIEIVALPQSIPTNIQIDISVLKEIGSEIKIQDLTKSDDYEILEDGDRVIASITAHKEESTEAQVERTEVEITTEKKVEEGDETEGAVEPNAETAKKSESTEKTSK